MGGFLSGVLGTNSGVDVNQQMPIGTQSLLGPAVQQNYNQQQQNYGNQNWLGQQLVNQMYGGGPNPEQLMLQQAQQANAAQGAQAYAGNRSINAGLAARNAANMQSQGNQQAAGQASLMRMNRSLGAQQQLQGLYGQQGQQNLAGQQIYQGAIANQNHAINQANAINAGVAAGNQQQAGNIMGGLLNGAGAALMAGGGQVQSPQDALNGFMSITPENIGTQSNQSDLKQGSKEFGSGAASAVGRLLSSGGAGGAGAAGGGGGAGVAGGGAGGAGALVQVAAMARGGMSGDYRSGGGVPGSGQVAGNSYANDTVPAMLSPKEIVLPRSVTMSDDAPERAKAFVAAVLAKKRVRM